VIFLVVIVILVGSLYFWLHAIPERIAHGASALQFQFVGVLSLLALFTHNNAFWVAALLLALVPIPDFWTPISSMADALTRLAARPWSREPSAAAVSTVEAAPPALPSSDALTHGAPAAEPGNADAPSERRSPAAEA
jgi:hypothetical protein